MTPKLLREILRYDPATGIFIWLVSPAHRAPAGSVAGSLKETGYRRISYRGHFYYAHRLAWLYVFGEPARLNIDHINGERDDNRIGNLRAVTHSQNIGNSRLSRANTSGFKGVGWDKARGKWAARIKVNYKFIHLGRFNNIKDAVAARLAADAKYFPK